MSISLPETISKARVLQLHLARQTMKKGNLGIDEYVIKMKTSRDDLSLVGSTIKDDDLVL